MSATIDPRIRERRVAVRRAEGRRRLRMLIAAGSVVATGAVVLGATRSPLLDVEEIIVSGTRRTAPSAVLQAADLREGMPMLDISPEGAAGAIGRLSWVESASVHRQWPGTVVVTVRERAPVAAVARPDGVWAVVDISGRVLALERQATQSLPHVHGTVEKLSPGNLLGEDAKGAIRVAAGLTPELRAVVGGVNLLPTGIELGLRTGQGVVRLGDASGVEEKLRAAATVLRRVPPRRIAVLDVRVPSAPVLARR